MLQQGSSLGFRLRGRFGLEIRMICHAGAIIAGKLMAQQGNLYQRPRLDKTDWLMAFLRAASYRKLV
jgi:hypothetical protein